MSLPLYIIEKKKKNEFSIHFKFYSICKQIKPDIVHSWSGLTTFYSILSKVLLKFKLINAQITSAPVNYKARFINYRVYLKALIQNQINFIFSDIVLSNSIAGLKSFNLVGKKYKVIHNGFDFDRLNDVTDTKEIRRKLNIETQYVICMVANFAARKDYKTFFNSALTIIDKRKDVTFLAVGAVGDGILWGHYKEKYSYYKNILLLGDQTNVLSIINIADICILTSHTDYGEGISNSIMEYMALNKPVIATNNGGNPELIEHGISGFLVTPNFAHDLIQSIDLLLNNTNQRENMGREGNKRLKEYFSLDKMVMNYKKLYNEFNNK